jgi:protein TonB
MLRSPVQPIYPLPAIRRELEGYVIVEFTVTRRGNVRDVSIVESSHREFEAAAANAVARSRYQPQVVDSVPVDVTGLRTRIEFVLDD